MMSLHVIAKSLLLWSLHLFKFCLVIYLASLQKNIAAPVELNKACCYCKVSYVSPEAVYTDLLFQYLL